MSSGHSKWPLPWQQQPLTLFIAVLLGVGPLYAMVIYSQLTSSTEPLVIEGHGWQLLGSSMLMVGVFGLLALAVLYLLCGETPRSLQLKRGNWRSDLNHSIGLAIVLMLSQWIFALLVLNEADLEQPTVVTKLVEQMVNDPVLLAIFLGPMIWIQAALFEEFTRIFALSRLFRIWPSKLGRVLAVLAMAALFGLGHLYQGFYGVAGTALIATILGLHYLRYGRVLPLIIAHGLYDTMVVLIPLYLYKQGLM